MPMKKFLFLLVLVFGFIAIPKLEASASKKENTIKLDPGYGITLQKFEPGMVHLTVWRDHQKTADIAQHQYPFRSSRR